MVSEFSSFGILNYFNTKSPEPTYTCPYCGSRFFTLDDFFGHIEGVHFPIPEDYYFCNYCGAEFSTLDALLPHFVDQHLDIITAPPPPITVYCPGQVAADTEFEVTHVFSLSRKSYGDRYFVAVDLKNGRGGRISGAYYVDQDMMSNYPQCFEGCLPLDHTGEYRLTEIAKIHDRGTFAIWSGARYNHISHVTPSCGLTFDQEYTAWYFDTGKKITVT